MKMLEEYMDFIINNNENILSFFNKIECFDSYIVHNSPQYLVHHLFYKNTPSKKYYINQKVYNKKHRIENIEFEVNENGIYYFNLGYIKDSLINNALRIIMDYIKDQNVDLFKTVIFANFNPYIDSNLINSFVKHLKNNKLIILDNLPDPMRIQNITEVSFPYVNKTFISSLQQFTEEEKKYILFNNEIDYLALCMYSKNKYPEEKIQDFIVDTVFGAIKHIKTYTSFSLSFIEKLREYCHILFVYQVPLKKVFSISRTFLKENVYDIENKIYLNSKHQLHRGIIYMEFYFLNLIGKV